MSAYTPTATSYPWTSSSCLAQAASVACQSLSMAQSGQTQRWQQASLSPCCRASPHWPTCRSTRRTSPPPRGGRRRRQTWSGASLRASSDASRL
eukprot:6175255-Pleurochrysis_carterae.AAC.2